MQKSNTIFRYSLVFLFILSLFSPSLTVAQKSEINAGREFYFGVPHCRKPAGEAFRGTSALQLWLSSKVKTRVKIKAEGIGYEDIVIVDANIVKVVPLSDALMNKISELPADNGIMVVSDEPISVTVLVSYRRSGEAFKVIPLEALGKKYYTLNLYQDQSGSDYKPSQILITATADNTVVSYTPTAETMAGVTPGQTTNVFLKKGQTFLIEGKIRPGQNQLKTTDLTGTYIQATKPISVIAGHTKGAFPRYRATMLGTPADFMRNMIIDAMWPVEFLGKEYVSAPVKYNNRPYSASDGDQRGDLIRFVATENGTLIQQMRQDGSGLKPISMILDKGQYFDIVEQEDAAYYKANHPVLVGQYGKAWRSSNVTLPGKDDGGDETLNPSRNGSGMLMTLTPMEQWGSNAVFRSVEEIDNFALIVFRSEHVDSIKFDKQPLRMAFEGIFKVQGTPYSYARKQISAGDHTFEGAHSGIRFAAYAYGNYDNTKDGFAYGYPTSVNYAIQCQDSLVVEAEPVCGDYTGLARALPANAECAAIYNAYMIIEKSFNYTFELKSPLEPGIKKLSFELKVIDKTKDAKAFVKVINRSGLDTTLELTYYAQQLVADPSTIDFGSLAQNSTKCGPLVLKNPGSVPTIITDLFIKGTSGEFTIDKSQLPITIPPGGTAIVEVCAVTGEGIVTRVDSVIAMLECYRTGIAVTKYSTSEAVLFIPDVSFGKGLIGRSKTKDVTIENRAKARVEIYSVDVPNDIPFTTENLMDKFPIILEAGQTHTFQLTYSPVLNDDGDPQKDEFNAIFKANTDYIKTNSLWSGEGIEVMPLGAGKNWEEQRVIDDYVKTKLNVTEWPGTVTFNAIWHNAPITVQDIYVIEDVDNVFRLDEAEVNLLKGSEILPNNTIRAIPAFFAPKSIGSFTAKVVLLGTTKDEWGNIEPRNDTVMLTGIGIQPLYDATDKDFGQVELNTPTPGTVRVNSTGNTELKIFEMRIEGKDAANFKIDPAFNGGVPASENTPVQILEGEHLDIPVIFTATVIKDNYDARIVYVTDAPNEDVSLLTGKAVSADIDKTDYAFPATYITHTNTSGVVECINLNANSKIEVTGVAFSGGVDDGRFAITGYKLKNSGTTFTTLPITIPENDALQVMVNFTPDVVRGDYAADILYTTSLGEVTSSVTGIGKDMTSLVKIERTYQASVGGSTPVTFDLKGSPDAINDGDITTFKATVNYDPTVVLPTTGKENIRTTAMTDGWEVVSADITDAKVGVFEVVLKTDDATKALKGEGPLFEFTLNGYLDDTKEIELPTSMTEYNRPWVNILNEPGLIAISPVCGGDLRLISLSSTEYQLMAMAPNPVSGPVVTIRYSVGLEAFTNLVLVDANGQVVANLVNERQKPGVYELGVDVSKFASGSYYYTIQSGPFTQTQQMLLAK